MEKKRRKYAGFQANEPQTESNNNNNNNIDKCKSVTHYLQPFSNLIALVQK